MVDAEPTWDALTYADLYIRHFLRGARLDTPKDRLSWYESQVSEFTVAELNDHWRWFWSYSEPIIVPYGDIGSSVPTVDEVMTAIETVEPRSREAPEDSLGVPIMNTQVRR